MWGRGALEKKIHLIKWGVVCSDKGKGGLGIRNLPKLNKALLNKWVWRFPQEDDSCWKRVISNKYGKEVHGWISMELQGPFEVCLWKEILKGSGWVSQNWKFRLGNGIRISF